MQCGFARATGAMLLAGMELKSNKDESKGTTGRARVTGTEKEKGKADERTIGKGKGHQSIKKAKKIRTFSTDSWGGGMSKKREGTEL